MEVQRRSIPGWPVVISLWRERSTEADGWVLINNTHLHLTIVIDAIIFIHVCLTNIDIVDSIDCLQVLQHESGAEKYLTVPIRSTSWGIGPDIDGKGSCWIKSASAGTGCPASPANKNSDRSKETSWQYKDGKEKWHNAEIVITCATHC